MSLPGAVRPFIARLAVGFVAFAQVLVVQPLAAENSVPPTGEGAQRTVASSRLPDNIPVKRETAAAETGSSGDAVRAIALLSLLAILAYPAARWWRSRASKISARGDRSKELTVVSAVRLTPRHSVHVVEWQGNRLLLGCSEHASTVLERRATETEES